MSENLKSEGLCVESRDIAAHIGRKREEAMRQALEDNNYLSIGERIVEFHGPAAWQIYGREGDARWKRLVLEQEFEELWVQLHNPQPRDLLIVRDGDTTEVLGIFVVTERLDARTLRVCFIEQKVVFGGTTTGEAP